MKKCFRMIGVWVLICALLITFVPCVSAQETVVQAAQIARLNSGYLAEEVAPDLGLTDAQYVKLQNVVFSAARNYQAECDISEFRIAYSIDANMALTSMIYRGDPESFHIKGVSYTRMTSDADPTGYFGKVKFTSYLYEKSVYQSMLAECEEAAKAFIGDFTNNMSDVQKVWLVHDRLCSWCTYDYDAYLNVNEPIPEDDYTIYGTLINQVAVCEGYAKTVNYLMDKLGIECYLCSSETLQHMWNVLKINGKYYHYDTTWDDQVYDITGRMSHAYMLRSTAGFRVDGHNATDYSTLPSDTTYDGYFWQHSRTAAQWMDGKVYFINNDEATLNSWDGNKITQLADVSDVWKSGNTARWPNSARLSSDEDYLYYSLSNMIYRYDTATGKSTAVYAPDMSGYAYFSIFGFMAYKGNFICDLYSSPNFESNTKSKYQIVYPYRNVKVASVSVQTPPTRTVYVAGETLDTAGLSLKVTYTNGQTAVITDGFTVSAPEFSGYGKKTVTVSFGGKTTTFDVELRRRAVSVAIASLPAKLEYEIGEAFDSTGLALTVKYDDGSSEQITDGFICRGFSSAVKGEKTVTVAYGDKATGFTVTVNAARTVTSAFVKSLPYKITYNVGDPLDLNGFSVILYYNDGSSEVVTSGFGEIRGFDSATAGSKTVTVTCAGQTVSFAVSVKAGSVTLGDVDGDGNITSTDARLVLQYYAKKIGGSQLNLSAADVDGDGDITSTDARLVLQYYAKKISEFPKK